jgi:plastocyanin
MGPRPGRLLPLLVSLTVLGACGGSPGGVGATCTPTGTTLRLLAHANRFSADCLAAPSGVEFRIVFENQDAGTAHNVSIYRADPRDHPGAAQLFNGRWFVGPATRTYSVRALTPGTYHFRCDLHPDQMNGTLVVSGG